MMSLPIERAICSWLEWARRVGMTPRWEFMYDRGLPPHRPDRRSRLGSHSSRRNSSHTILLLPKASMKPLLFQRHIGEPDQGRRFLEDEPGRHFREHRRKSALGLETLAEGGGRERLLEARQDSAGDIDTAKGADGEREVAGDATEKFAAVVE